MLQPPLDVQPLPDERAQVSLLRQAGRAAVLSLAGTPALIVAALVERRLSTR
ncbi:hypothetical protein GCM10010495_76100 [Kitasatospora herbaricolor]|uniref:hypothetical protein n=1 Tax=Kitasatospora herbaricolor TaxID=68217 RepID=UPI00174E9784|nr:hypothetical protein [Kitasatospora herbaricolor]MDQ0305616.1 chitinase [Kitasatospora herbaricolor]GGV47180.1 hypothetical protein GCM10010495_76100 [Kitasatospora herbaricolor]